MATAHVALAIVLAAAAAGCQPETASGDVVIAVGTSTSAGQSTRYVECGPPGAAVGTVTVTVPAETAETIPDGAPCPDGPRKPTASIEHPQLYSQLSRALRDMPFEGGDAATCGRWTTADAEQARQLAADCPPLITGQLD